LSDWLARPGDRDAFALFDAGDEVRKPRLGGVDIDSHAERLANLPGLIKSSLVSGELCRAMKRTMLAKSARADGAMITRQPIRRFSL